MRAEFIKEKFYLSDSEANVKRALTLTGLAQDELETLVGRFKPHSIRKGLLRGEVLIGHDNTVTIRHGFTKKVLWRDL